MQVVLALGAIGSLADFLYSGQQQADEDSNDGYHHQQSMSVKPRHRRCRRWNGIRKPPQKMSKIPFLATVVKKEHYAD